MSADPLLATNLILTLRLHAGDLRTLLVQVSAAADRTHWDSPGARACRGDVATAVARLARCAAGLDDAADRVTRLVASGQLAAAAGGR